MLFCYIYIILCMFKNLRVIWINGWTSHMWVEMSDDPLGSISNTKLITLTQCHPTTKVQLIELSYFLLLFISIATFEKILTYKTRTLLCAWRNFNNNCRFFFFFRFNGGLRTDVVGADRHLPWWSAKRINSIFIYPIF